MTKIAQSEATKKLQLTKNRLIEAAKSTEIELYENFIVQKGELKLMRLLMKIEINMAVMSF